MVLIFVRLRSPKAPDEEADMGLHEFSYAVLPHSGRKYFKNHCNGVSMSFLITDCRNGERKHISKHFFAWFTRANLQRVCHLCLDYYQIEAVEHLAFAMFVFTFPVSSSIFPG